MGVREMEQIGDWIADRLAAPGDEATEQRLRAAVVDLTASFPVPGVVQPVAV
jgi:glycine/serine hydroxymethyltransferase